jgi:putative permease
MTESKNFFKSRHWKVFLVTFSISAPIFILSRFNDLFLILVVSFAATFVLRPVVDYLEGLGLKRTAAILIIYLVLGSVAVIGLMMLYPMLVSQIAQISISFSGEKLSAMLNQLSEQVTSDVPFLKSDEVRAQLNSFVLNIGTYAGQALSSVAGMLATLAIVPFITFFFLNDYYEMQKSLIQNLPNKYFEMSLNLIYKLEDQLTKYIRGTVTESMVVAMLYTASYFFLGINYATVLGLIGGIMNIIPFAGPFIGAVPVLLVSIVQYGDLHMLIPIVISTVVVQQLDQMFVQPTVFSKIMDIPPLTMFIVILAGNEILGVMGMILAVPIYTVIVVTAKETNWGLKNYKITW